MNKDKDMDKKIQSPSNNKAEEITKESFRQNAAFAEKILADECIFHQYPVKYDVRQIDKKEVESMLHARSIYENEPAPGFVHLGRKGINGWIWENKTSNIIFPPLQNFLATKLNNDASKFYKYYKLVSDLMQKVALYHQVTFENLNVSHFSDPNCINHLKNGDKKTRLDQKFLIEIVSYLNKDSSSFNSIITTSIRGRAKKKSLHPKIKDYLQYLTKHGISEISQRTKLNHLHQLLQWLCNQMADFQDCTPENISFLRVKEIHLQDFRVYLLKKLKLGLYSDRTVSECIYAVRDFFKFLKKTFGFSNPSIRLKSIKTTRYKARWIPTEIQIEQFLQVIKIYSNTPLLESIAFRLMLDLGLRSNEVIKVAWNDINLGCHTISIHSKGGKHHVLPLVEELYELIKQLSQQQNNNSFLFGVHNKLSYSRLIDNYHLYALLADWDCAGGLHLLRHIFITRTAKKNPIPQLLKELSRVVSMDTVSLYMHLDQQKSRLRKEINKLDYGMDWSNDNAPI